MESIETEVKMRELNFRRRQKKLKADVFEDETDHRVQFNIVVDLAIKSAVQEMAKQFRLNQSVVAAHMLQIGLYYMAIAMKDEGKKRRIEEHLVDAHLLQYASDEEVIIRSMEPNQNWMLLAHSRQVVAKAVRLRNVLDQVRKTGDFDLAEREEKELRKAILEFADYLVQHRFEEMEDY